MALKLVKLIGNGVNNVVITGGLVPKGAYDNSTDYAVGDSVDYQGSSYVMYSDAGAGTLPTDDTKWQLIASKGDNGSPGANGNDGAPGADGFPGLNIVWKGAYDGGTTYDQNDAVSDNGSSYISKQDSNVGNPTSDTDYWDLWVERGQDGVVGSDGAPGADGADGAMGLFGGDSFSFTFSTVTDVEDPGGGYMRFGQDGDLSHDNSDLVFDIQDKHGTDISLWLDGMNLTSGTFKGVIKLFKVDDASKWAVFRIESMDDNDGFFVGTAYVIAYSSETPFSNGDEVVATFVYAGASGSLNANWQGDWASAVDYPVDAVVVNNNAVYVCSSAHTSGSDDDEPGVGANWEAYWLLLVTGSTVSWGDIAGTLSDQTDLQAALDAKQDELTGLTSSVAELNILDGVTATASELNALDGITATVTELNYTDGVTSAIQTQIDGKQDSDSDLTAIAGLSPSNDDIIQRKAGAWTNRTVAQLKSDLALNNVSNVDQIPLSYLDTDSALTANSDSKVASQKAIKSYVDGVASGLSIKKSVRLGTAAALPANTYLSGVITITATGVLTVDGSTVALNDRVLVKDESTAANNGIYTCTTAGAIGVSAVLTRSSDMDVASEIPGAFTFVEEGSTNSSNGFVVASAGPFTVGTTAINWTQFSGAGSITAGNALTKSGNTLDVAVDGSTIEINSDALRVKDSGITTSKLGGDVTTAGKAILDDADASAQRTTLGVGTGDSPQFTGINVGHASDTTITRAASGGDILVEGNQIYRAGGNDVAVADGGTGSSTAAGAATNLGLGTGDSPQFTAVNIGHASDTTVTRTGAGDLAIEGNAIYRAGGTDVPVADGGTGSSTSEIAYNNVADMKFEPTSDDTSNGPHTNDIAAGATITQWDCVYLGSGGKWLQTDADAESTSKGLLGLSLESKSDTQAMDVALPGSICRNDGWNWTTVGAPLYLSTTTGAITDTQPSGTDDVIRVIGYVMSDDCIFFHPSPDYITHT